jgi:hypothetical protein
MSLVLLIINNEYQYAKYVSDVTFSLQRVNKSALYMYDSILGHQRKAHNTPLRY